MNFLKQPVARDTTPNSGAEILRRLATVGYPLGLIGGPVIAGIGVLRGSMSGMVTGGVLMALGAGLHLTRARWRDATKAPETKAKSSPVAAASSATPVEDGPRPRIVLLNASSAGEAGNSARLLAKIEAHLAERAEVVRAALVGAEGKGFAALVPELRAADGVVIATGTHWDGWSWALQKFLEDATPSEATSLWLGLPVAVVVSEHSTGGKGVLSRLQGVLVTFGCAIPPLSGLVISKSAQLARKHAPEAAEDFWGADDLEVVADNLLTAARQPLAAWRAWPVDRADFARRWVE